LQRPASLDRQTFGWILKTVLGSAGAKASVVLPKQWIVERTFAWLSIARCFSKVYERLPQTTESLISIRMIHLMSRQLAYHR
jgi:transposase